MSADFELGKRFSACIKSVNPDSQQKLSALLNDIAGSDAELASAFRLLFCNPVYVSLFLAQAPLRAAERASLNTIAQSSLSSALASRAEEFVRGYFDLATDAPSVSPSSAAVPRQQDLESQQHSAPFYPSRFNYHQDVQEEVTLFADDTPSNAQHLSASSPVAASKDLPRTAKKLPVKAIFALTAIVALCVSMFKVKAICEPFGLCSKGDVSGSEDTDKKPAESPPEPQTPTKPSKDIPAKPLRRDSNEYQIMPSKPRPKVLPPTSPRPLPNPDQSQVRDEPLW